MLKLKSIKNKKKYFSGNLIEISPIITVNEKLLILEKIYNSYEERLNESENIVSIISGIFADIDFLIANICVKNFELSEFSYEELENSGFINFIKKNIYNYEDIRKACIDMIQFIRLDEIFPNLDKNFSLEELLKDKSEEEINSITNVVKQITENL